MEPILKSPAALGLALLLSLMGFGPALADGALGPSFKRLKVGERTGGRFITIQIEPKPATAPVLPRRPQIDRPPETAALPDDRPTRAAPGTGWFWSAISPDLAAARPRRLAEASQLFSTVSGPGAALTPSLARVERIAADHGVEILRASAGHGVSPALVLAVIVVESNGRPKAESHAGAVGLMQLMPATAARFGVTDRTNPSQNIRGGVEYLAWLLKEFNGDAVLALAGYNAGEGAVRKNGGVPNYRETRDYVPKVVAAWRVARALCLTPPQDADDGCVFAGLTLAGG